jgi:23S rRNA (cytidine2498-2'-O)-methyltransferase
VAFPRNWTVAIESAYDRGVTTAYLAAEGFETQLLHELHAAGTAVRRRHERLLVTDGPAVPVLWAANVWHDAAETPVASIGEAARVLRGVQRNWAVYAPVHSGRAKLVVERLPHVSAKPLAIGELAPAAPLGSWTFLDPNTVLFAARCDSAFPNGEPRFVEDREGPPSRAYLKLWEAFVRLGRWPVPGDRCLDLGACPGGWTWLLAEVGGRVTAVDKAPLDPSVAALPGVRWIEGSAFTLGPDALAPASPLGSPPIDWLCSDIVAYPERLLTLVAGWLASGRVRNVVCTVKFQGDTDHAVLERFAALPRAQLFHLHHNKHEVTFASLADDGQVRDEPDRR